MGVTQNVNCQTERGATPLHHAAGWGHVEVVTALLAAGADKTIKNYVGSTPHDNTLCEDCKKALE